MIRNHDVKVHWFLSQIMNMQHINEVDVCQVNCQSSLINSSSSHSDLVNLNENIVVDVGEVKVCCAELTIYWEFYVA